jgi:hypothetical protein
VKERVDEIEGGKRKNNEKAGRKKERVNNKR